MRIGICEQAFPYVAQEASCKLRDEVHRVGMPEKECLDKASDVFEGFKRNFSGDETDGFALTVKGKRVAPWTVVISM